MNAKELRIGNLIQFEGKQCTVKEIDQGGAVVLFEDEEEIWIDIFQLEPIPLTEEKIVKLLFWHDDYYNSAKRFVSKSPIILIKGNGYYTLCHYPICKIQYVHQLQNVVFDIKGQELT